MKRQAITLGDLAERNNLLLAVHKAARGKRQRPAVADFLAHLDTRLNHLAATILAGTAPTGHYRSFTIYDPKRRQIHAACFADRVLHHAIMNLAEPRFETMLVDSSYACRPGKGVHAAANQVQRHLRRFAWLVQTDIHGYFPASDHAHLKALLATRFKGADFLALLGRIIDGGSPPGAASGLPIGTLTSQHFANAYLDLADRWLQEHHAVRAHVRYMDDIVWWCDSRADAIATLAQFADFLRTERALLLKPQPYIGPSSDGLAFCGFRIRQGVILPSQRKLTRYRQGMTRIERAFANGQCDEAQLQRAADSVHATLAGCESDGFRRYFWKQRPSVYDIATCD